MPRSASATSLLVSCGALLALASVGCRPKPAPIDDAALASRVQASINGDTPLAGQPIGASVSAGVVTLSGTVLNEAQRTIAARDAAGVPGVKAVRDALTILQPQPASPTTTLPANQGAAAPVLTRIPVPPSPVPAQAVRDKATPVPPLTHQAAPIERAYNNPPAQQPAEAAPVSQPPVQQAPPPPPRPAFREVTLPAGTVLPIRFNQTLDSANAQQGDSFSGIVTSDVFADGTLALASGTAVSGHVDAVQEAAHFKGNSLLTVSLSSVTSRGERIPVTTEPYTVTGKGRGKNTAEKTGGGAAVGAVLGGIFGGGKGAAIGAGAGAGVGAGANAVTRGQQVQIESESVVRFKTSSDLSLRVRAENGGSPAAGVLQPR